MKYIASLFFVCLLAACSGPSRLEQVLILADENRAELEKVLAHYSQTPADSLKYRDACKTCPVFISTEERIYRFGGE